MSAPDVHGLALEVEDEVVSDRRRIHQRPELSGQETGTAQLVAERLTQLGLRPRLLLDGRAVVADIEGQEAGGRRLLLRADSDALPLEERVDHPYRSQVPGAMHACGHDGHVAILMGVARLLTQLRPQLGGTVRLAFQPAEETAQGAAPMLAAGVLEDPVVEGSLGLHIWNGLPVGQVGVRDGAIFASADEFRIEIRGRGGHGALPHQALDPVPIAGLVLLGLQTLVSRETSPLNTAVVTVGQVKAGQAFNVIPETVQLTGTVRAFSPQDRERLLRRIGEVAQGIASAFGASASCRRGPGCPPVVCDPGVASLVREAVRETPGAELVEPQPLTVGDDVGLFLERAPGCYFLLGAGNPAKGIGAPHHHPEFDLDESCLAVGVEVLTRSALRFCAGSPAEA